MILEIQEIRANERPTTTRGGSLAYVISGHGPASEPAIEPRAIVTEQRVYLEDLMAAVKEAMDAGTHGPDALREAVKLPKYRSWRHYDDWLPMNIERIWAYYHMGW
jgi:hypothetical protein